MKSIILSTITLGLTLASSVVGHATCYHEAMFGFNYTGADKPHNPLQQRTFDDWWFHGKAHLSMPPNKGDFLEFPAGGSKFVEITCDKGASSSYTSNPGGDIREGNHVCPGNNTLEFHAKNINDVKGSVFAIAYTPVTQVNSIKPEDFVIFTVNHTSVWERFTKYEIPAKMPACPPGGCTCAWFWIHSADAGAEQIYMNGYACQITGATSSVPLAKPHVPRRCGADNDPELVKPAAPQNCTYGAKTPIYWNQKDGNNLFEGTHAAPYYNDLYGFSDGAQNDIFLDSKLPAMNWAGAPKTGSLQAVAGVFPSGGSAPAPAGSSDPEPASPSSTPSSTPQAAPPNASASATHGGSKPKPTTKGTGSTSDSGKGPKKCKRSTADTDSEKKKKRSFIDNLVQHRRQHSRRHNKH